MAIKHNYSLTVSNGSVQLVNTQWSTTEENENNLDVTIAPAASDYLINWTCDVSNLRSVTIVATAAMTIETNSSSSPTDTLTMVANVPIVWHHQQDASNCPCPFTADVTSLYVTSTPGGNLKIVPNLTA